MVFLKKKILPFVVFFVFFFSFLVLPFLCIVFFHLLSSLLLYSSGEYFFFSCLLITLLSFTPFSVVCIIEFVNTSFSLFSFFFSFLMFLPPCFSNFLAVFYFCKFFWINQSLKQLYNYAFCILVFISAAMLVIYLQGNDSINTSVLK